MTNLHEFIPSPRAAKRFINIYRLLRASVEQSEQRAFVGNEKEGEYQCALILLAMLTGYSAETTEILRSLIQEEHRETWGHLVQSFRTRVESEPPPGGPAVEVDVFSSAQRQRWLELFDRLSRVQNNLRERSCVGFKRWAPRVARYSFQSGRVLLRA